MILQKKKTYKRVSRNGKPKPLKQIFVLASNKKQK